MGTVFCMDILFLLNKMKAQKTLCNCTFYFYKRTSYVIYFLLIYNV